MGPSKKTTQVTKAPKDEKKRNKNQVESFAPQMYQVLKQVHSDIGISKKAMSIMNSLINDTFDRIALEASKLVKFKKRKTLSTKEVQIAVKLLLPGALSQYAAEQFLDNINDQIMKKLQKNICFPDIFQKQQNKED